MIGQRSIDAAVVVALLTSAVPSVRAALQPVLVGEPLVAPIIAIAALHVFVVGLVAMRRRSVAAEARPAEAMQALPAVAAGLLVFIVADAPDLWPMAVQILFVAATGLVILSLGWLGRSFAILPSARALVASGPYRLLRHPAYAGELLMLGIACLTASDRPLAIGVFMAAVALVAWRIHVEEAVLRRGLPGYADYASRVRWRLLPMIW